MPALSFLNDALGGRKPLERHADRKFNTLGFEQADNGVNEEGAIHTHLNEAFGQYGPDLADKTLNEGHGTIGVVDIAGPMPHIEYLACLSEGAKQVMVAALAFLLAIEAYGCAMKDTQVCFPLSNSTALIGEFVYKDSDCGVNSRLVSAFNSKTIQFAYNQVYAPKPNFKFMW